MWLAWRRAGLVPMVFGIAAAALSGCVQPPPPPPAPQAALPAQTVNDHKPRRRPVKVAASAKPVCQPGDPTGLSAEQKEHVFQQFDAWQAAHRNDPNSGDAGAAPPDLKLAEGSPSPTPCAAAPR